MSKKPLAACIALAVMAFPAIPSFALAKHVVTHPTGMVLPTPAVFTGTNVGETVMETPIGPLKCTKASMTGRLTTNSTAAGFEGNIETASFQGTGTTVAGEPLPECTGAFGNASITPTVSAAAPWCLEGTAAAETFALRGGSCSGATKALEFQIVVTIFGAPVNCSYARTALEGPLVGKVMTHPNEFIEALEKQRFPVAAGQSGFCPSKVELTMSLTVETDAVAAAPLYLSS